MVRNVKYKAIKLELIRQKRQRQRSKKFYKKSEKNIRCRNAIVYTLQALVLGNFMVIGLQSRLITNKINRFQH